MQLTEFLGGIYLGGLFATAGIASTMQSSAIKKIGAAIPVLLCLIWPLTILTMMITFKNEPPKTGPWTRKITGGS